jgi:F-type H+-transporting ATPase subunit b
MLDISPGLLLLVAVIFIFLIIVLNKILYKPLLTFMHERDESIKNDLEQAKKNSSNVSHLEEEALGLIKHAKNEAHKIREEAINLVKTEYNEKIEAKKAVLEKAYESFLLELNQEKEELSSRLKNELPVFKDSLKTKLSQI